MRWSVAVLCAVAAGCSGEKKSANDAGPPAPSLVVSESAFVEPDAVVAFDWNAVDGASSYRLYWQSTPGVTTQADHVIEVPGSSVSATATIPACMTTIFAAIASVDQNGEGPLSAERSGRFCPGGCARPAEYPAPGFVVDPIIGNDLTANPSCFPYETLAAAVAGRADGDVVYLHGDVLIDDLVLSSGLTLVGNPLDPEAAKIDGTGASTVVIEMQSRAIISGLSITAPLATAVRVIGRDARIENVHTAGSETGVQLAGPGATIDGLVSTDNSLAGVLSTFAVEPWGATISNSVIKNNAVGLYIDSYYVSSLFTITDSTIGCNASHDIHAYAPNTPSPASIATITFTFTNLTMDVTPARRDESAAGCPTAGVELCVPLTVEGGETPGLVVFNEAAIEPFTTSCP